MRRFLLAGLISIASASTALGVGYASNATSKDPRPPACCKVCKKGQACGNTCISWEKTCHQPPGCACQG